MPYHHGDLPRALLDATAELVAEAGPFSWSLREVARRAGVSHAAPAHHFGDKAGLLRALATEGFELLSRSLHEHDRESEGRPAVERHAHQAWGYVRFATEQRGHFEVMFRFDLFGADEALEVAAAGAYAALEESAARVVADRGRGEIPDVALASWSVAHGLATLHNVGMLATGHERTPSGPLREVVDRVVAVLSEGLAPAPAPRERSRPPARARSARPPRR